MHSISPHQFKLFMTGSEWKEKVTHSTDGPLPDLWKEKGQQAKDQGLYRDMKEKGYQHNSADPPTIVLEDSPNGKTTRYVQSEGHHRVAAAADIERDTGQPVYIPTNYVNNTRKT